MLVFVWGKSVLEESGLILERTVSGFWHMIYPLVRRLVQRGVKERKGAQKGLRRHGVECVCWHSHENCGTTIIRMSVHQACPETSRDGSVLFGQQHWELPQRQRVNVYCTGTRIIPPPPLPELETFKCKHGWGCPSVRSSGQQGALRQNAEGNTFFKGKLEVSCWPEQSSLSVTILKQLL